MNIFKKILTIITAVTLLFLFTACKNDNENQFIMKAKIISINEKIEVEVIYDEYATGTYLVITSNETEFIGLFGAPITKNDLNEGAVIEIVYGGQVMMSIPPQIVAKKIKVVN